jgi:hypothetical protein
MPTPEQVRSQIQKITEELIGMSLTDRQNFPSMRPCGNDILEIGSRGANGFGFMLKNVPYRDIYTEIERTQTYNFRMLDGALIQMMYRFHKNRIEQHRLTFFPSPDLEEFQSNPNIYIEDEIYADVIMRNIVPFPLRFDFDSRETVFVEIEHPRSHLTLGQYQNCRIPVSAPLTPCSFIQFILRNFYNTAYNKYSAQLSQFAQRFDDSITRLEKSLVHVTIPI